MSQRRVSRRRLSQSDESATSQRRLCTTCRERACESACAVLGFWAGLCACWPWHVRGKLCKCVGGSSVDRASVVRASVCGPSECGPSERGPSECVNRASVVRASDRDQQMCVLRSVLQSVRGWCFSTSDPSSPFCLFWRFSTPITFKVYFEPLHHCHIHKKCPGTNRVLRPTVVSIIFPPQAFYNVMYNISKTNL